MTWGLTAVAGATLVGSAISANASKNAANTQAGAASDAQANQLAMAQTAITAQQEVLNQQLRAQQGVMDSQLKTQFDALAQQKTALDNAYQQQTNIAAQTRDQQLNLAGTTKNDQLALAQGVLDNQVNTYQPYNQAGLAGQNRLLEYLGIGGNAGSTDYGKYATAEFTPTAFLANQDPGYGFRMSEGLKAVDRQAAARGGLISGNALKASQTYGQDMASQEYQNAYNRYQTSRAGTLSPLQSLQGY